MSLTLKPRNRKRLVIDVLQVFSIVAGLLLSASGYAVAGNVSINLDFKNPSEIEEKKDLIKSYLPVEIKKEDVIDAGGLELGYDPGRSVYYVFSNASLKPKENKKYKIVVRDVWKISDDEVAFLRRQADTHLKTFEKKEGYEAAKALHADLIGQLDEIKATQDLQLADVQKRIESFRASHERLRTFRNFLIVDKDFKREADIRVDNSKNDKEIKFIVQIKNPSQTQTMKEELTRFLPQGIIPDQISDLQGFIPRFDAEKKLWYLIQSVELAPQESKVFTVKIKDRWIVLDEKLTMYEEKAKKFMDLLKDSASKPTAEYLFNEINVYIGQIRESQTKKKSIQDKIAAYEENLKRVEVIKRDLEEMERLVDEETERIKKNKLQELLKRLTPDDILTWKIIYGTIIFLGVISFLMYLLWWGQTKSKYGKELDEITPGKGTDKKA